MNSIKDPFIVKVFEASSCHITQEDDALLQREDLSSLATYKVKGGDTLYGFLIYTGLEDTSIVEDTRVSDMANTNWVKAEGFSDAFINLLKLAKKNGCKFLQLDCGGVEYEDLPKFEW